MNIPFGHKHKLGSVLLVVLTASFALFLAVIFQKPYGKVALGVNCPAGLAGEMDLCVSTRIPRAGDVLSFTINTRQASVVPITVYVGTKPGVSGDITNPQVLTSGSTNSSGAFDFTYTIPVSDPLNTNHYFRGEAQIAGATLKTNQQGITVIPKVTDAKWIVTPSTYCQVQANGSCIPISNSKPIDKVYTLATSGDTILVEDGSYSSVTLKRPGCHSLTGPMIWLMARNINGPLIQKNPVGGSNSIVFQSQACWTTMVGFNVEGDDTAAIHFFTSGNEPYRNIQFLETSIDGGYDWYASAGFDSKWGLQSYLLTGFLWRGGSIKNIHQEHAFYVHNAQSDPSIAGEEGFYLEDLIIKRVGRTALQMTARDHDCDQYQNPCPSGSGNVQVRHVSVYDAGLGDFCQGGASLTFAGRNSFNIVIEDTYVESGLDPALVAATGCTGTEELVTWAGGGSLGLNNGPITVRRSKFLVAANQGNKNLSEIDVTPLFTLINTIMTSGKRYAMSIYNGVAATCLDRVSAVTGVPEQRVTAYGATYNNYQTMLDTIGDCGGAPPPPPPSLPTVTITASDAGAAEAGLDPGAFIISRTGATTNSLTVLISISGTAANGADYQQITSPRTISAGQSSVNVVLTPIDDSATEGAETAIIALVSDLAYTIGSPSSATINIADDDGGSPPPPPIGGGDSQPPSVYIVYPINLSTVSGFVIPTASASDDVGVVGVQFRLNGVNLGPEDLNAPYDVNWDTMATLDGNHNLMAIVRDAAGNTSSYSINVVVQNYDSQSPIVSITYPANLATVSGFIVITANAYDNAGVAGVQFRLDGVDLAPEDAVTPYIADLDTTQTYNGSHNIVAIARDSIGNTSGDAVNIVINNAANQPSAQPPAPGAPSTPSSLNAQVISPNQIKITWINTAVNQTGFKVEMSVDGKNFSEIKNLPANYYYNNIVGLAPKTAYYFRMRAYNGAGDSVYSNIVNAATPATATAPIFTIALYRGLINSQVGLLQQCLAKDVSVYPQGTVSNYFGALTEQAVQKFQIKNNIVASGAPQINGFGVVGLKTRVQLNEICAGAANSGAVGDITKTLYLGNVDPEVRILQQFLAKNPSIYPQGTVSGYFGPATELAVKIFQAKNNIVTLGIVGPQTRGVINDLIKRGVNP